MERRCRYPLGRSLHRIPRGAPGRRSHSRLPVSCVQPGFLCVTQRSKGLFQAMQCGASRARLARESGPARVQAQIENSGTVSAEGEAPQSAKAVPPQTLIRTNSLVAPNAWHSLPSRRRRQAERSRSPEANPEPARRCCWNRLRCGIKLPCGSAANVAPASAVSIACFGSCCRLPSRNRGVAKEGWRRGVSASKGQLFNSPTPSQEQETLSPRISLPGIQKSDAAPSASAAAWGDRNPIYAIYRKRTSRKIPIVEITPG